MATSGSRVRAEICKPTHRLERYRLRFGAFGNWDDRRAEHRAILEAAAVGDANLPAYRREFAGELSEDQSSGNVCPTQAARRHRDPNQSDQPK